MLSNIMKKIILTIITCCFFSSAFALEINDKDYYRWPIYKSSTKNKVKKFLDGETFHLWDYGFIYDKVPEKYAKKMNAKYGFFCSSGTSALHASLMALGLKNGDKIAVPAMTFIRSITPMIHMGIQPVLVDIDPKTGNIDPKSLEKLQDKEIKAVIVVHMWGMPANINKILKIAKLIEDFSHAHYSKTKEGYVGTLGDIGFGSLQRKKTISVGEGGLIVTNNKEIFHRVRNIISPGSYDQPKNSIDHSGYGLNMRMAPTAVVIADDLFNYLDEVISLRSGSAEHLLNMLKKYPEVFEITDSPDYIEKISWYALRIKAKVPLSKLKNAAKNTRWKFSKFDYPMIADHCFWNKDKVYFPFSQQIKAKNIDKKFPGAEKYMQNRISVKIPTISSQDWSEKEVELWHNDLKTIINKLAKS